MEGETSPLMNHQSYSDSMSKVYGSNKDLACRRLVEVFLMGVVYRLPFHFHD